MSEESGDIGSVIVLVSLVRFAMTSRSWNGFWVFQGEDYPGASAKGMGAAPAALAGARASAKLAGGGSLGAHEYCSEYLGAHAVAAEGR